MLVPERCSISRAAFEWDVDHESDNAWCLISTVDVPVGAPLDEDHEDHVSESARHEQDLWDELEDEINPVDKVDSIGTFEQNAEKHLDHAVDDSEFHLE